MVQNILDEEKKEREDFFFHLQELISRARKKEHLGPSEATWETLAGQPEDLHYCFCPSCIWMSTLLFGSIVCPGMDIFSSRASLNK